MLIVFKNTDEFQKKLLINGYSLRSFAREAGLSSPYLSQIIKKKRNPSAKTAKKITDELNVEFDDIFFIQSVSKKEHEGEDSDESSTS